MHVYILLRKTFVVYQKNLQNHESFVRITELLSFTVLQENYILSTVVLNSRDRQGMYGMQHFHTPRNPPYKRI